MKRFTTLAIFIALVTITFAQTHMYIWKNGVKTNYAISEVDSVTFGEEETQKQVIGVFSVSADKQVIFSKRNKIFSYIIFKLHERLQNIDVSLRARVLKSAPSPV